MMKFENFLYKIYLKYLLYYYLIIRVSRSINSNYLMTIKYTWTQRGKVRDYSKNINIYTMKYSYSYLRYSFIEQCC